MYIDKEYYMRLRSDFPFFDHWYRGRPLVYFDNAATTHKPGMMIDGMADFYRICNATVHRGTYYLSEEATDFYEQARAGIAQFIGAQPEEIVFTSGTTEGINLIATVFGRTLAAGDEILITELEHHSNMLPWQFIAQQYQAVLRYIPVLADGTLDMASLPSLLTSRTKIVSVAHISNVLGVHNPIQEIIDKAHAVGAAVMIDAAQSVAHQTIDVQKMKCDFLAFSGHKMWGPTGVGVLYINKKWHDVLTPYQLGGGMVYNASWQKSSFRPMPALFEAGTPPIAAAIGLRDTISYIENNIEWPTLRLHEAELCTVLIEGLAKIPSIRVLGPLEQLKKVGHMVTFTVDGMHAHDVAAYLDRENICVRAGHHCAQPLAERLGIEASVRASFSLYNMVSEVEFLLKTLHTMHINK